MIEKKIVLVFFVAWIASWSVATAAPIFSDGFETADVNKWPDRAKWSWCENLNYVYVSDADACAPPEGKKYLRLGGYRRLMEPIITGKPFTSLVVEVYVKIDASSSSWYKVYLSKGPQQDTWASLEWSHASDPNSYNVKVFTNSGSVTTLLTQQPTNEWHLWSFVANITNTTTGAGTYSVYEDGEAIVQDVSMTPYDFFGRSIDYVRMEGRNSSIDLVRVYSTFEPFPRPPHCGDGGTTYKEADVNLDCYVNFLDIAILAEQWLECSDPASSSCNLYL